MLEIGSVVAKNAGRDAGKVGAVIKIVNEKFVMVDGFCRRKKVNIRHLIPLNRKINIKENAKREEIIPLLDRMV
ncbi:MAG TPA: 50S ribosomal protein L14e [Candidatus Woesearchaeota archaeon]|nr:50S ribosomal protein L14e [Candidatus Woesearchaeota archaeon]